MVKVLAVTGGIGCGKSFVVKIFAALGIPAYLADERTKALYAEDAVLRDGLVEILGDGVFRDGVLQPRVMAGLIFSDRVLLARVEALVHPCVERDFQVWRDGAANACCPFVIVESAIFLEKPEFRVFADRVLTISSSVELRLSRVVGRDGVSREDVLARMGNQWSDVQREVMADFVVVSDQSRALLAQVVGVYDEMLLL